MPLQQNETASLDPPASPLETLSDDDFGESSLRQTLETDTAAVDKCSDILYEGTNVSVLKYHSMILQYSLMHCLSKTAVSDLLVLIADLLPKPNNAARSVYKHEKFFSIFEKQSFVQKHQFCAMCHHLFNETESLCPNGCNATVESFLICDIEHQIQSTLSGIAVTT